jgi:predicted metal-dependent phosphoesterase TrpH
LHDPFDAELQYSVRLELHCHSTLSDGSLAPEQLAQQLLDHGPEIVCLTDHDTMAGCERLALALAADARGREIRVLRGLELTCTLRREGPSGGGEASDKRGHTIHLLVWGVADGPGRTELERCLAEQGSRRRERIVAICERLATLGVQLDPEPILRAAVGRTPGRPDVANALVSAGICSSTRSAFDRYLRDDGPANVAIESLTLADALALGRAAGARMGLAHPHTLRQYALVRELFVEFRPHGLEGIEAFYGHTSPTRAQPWLRLARELDLIVTAGSDFHDPLGEVARPGIQLPLAYAPRLREWLADAFAITSPA